MENKKYVVLTLPNGAVYKISLDILRQLMAANMATTGDIDLSDAQKQANNTGDGLVMSFATSLTWDIIEREGSQVQAGKYEVMVSENFHEAKVTMMTETEIDRYKLMIAEL